MNLELDRSEISKIEREVKAARETFDSSVNHVVAKHLWFQIDELAKRELKSTYLPFVRGVEVDVSEKGVIFTLSDFALGVETGFRRRDLRSMLSGPSAKTSDDGSKYVDIPFRAATPRTTGRGANFASTMDRHAYEAVKRLGRLSNADLGPERGVNKMTGYRHKNHIYDGLTRLSNPTGTGSAYMSFRRLSENSDPDSFVIKAVKGRFIIKRAVAGFDVGSVVNEIN